MGRLLEYLAFLRSKTIDDIPRRIRGKTMPGYDSPTSIASTDGTIVIHTGQDPNSCTSTVAALMLWLCGVSDIPQAARQPFSSLPNLCELDDQLLVFSTPFHKFVYLCVDSQACLLHSNQDAFTLADGVAFSLWDYLENPQLLNPAQLRACFDRLNVALADTDTCREVYKELFGTPWNRGDPSEYWFATLPVQPLQALV